MIQVRLAGPDRVDHLVAGVELMVPRPVRPIEHVTLGVGPHETLYNPGEWGGWPRFRTRQIYRQPPVVTRGKKSTLCEQMKHCCAVLEIRLK